ncbi:MAG: RluA family pseudouridine synthase [Planctomycetota bacterium]
MSLPESQSDRSADTKRTTDVAAIKTGDSGPSGDSGPTGAPAPVGDSSHAEAGNRGAKSGKNHTHQESGAPGDSSNASSSCTPTDLDQPGVTRDVFVAEGCGGQRVDLFLTSICDGNSRSQIRDAIQAGGCEVDGRIIRPSFKVKVGQRVRFNVPEALSDETVAENIPLDVLYEDDGLVVVNKPAGMVVHPARGNWTGTLTSALAYRFQSLSDVGGPTRPGIIHRLDRDTSGVIVVAKTNAVHTNLAEQFHDRKVKKEYVAITCAPVDRDRDVIDAPIGRHPYQRDKQAIRPNHDSSKPASTFYEVESRRGRYCVVNVHPKTGRTHQIRVHLAHIGAPILCDRLYAGHCDTTASQLAAGIGTSSRFLQTELDSGRVDPDRKVLQRQALHARRLTLTNPQSGREMTFEAPFAPDMQDVIELLG